MAETALTWTQNDQVEVGSATLVTSGDTTDAIDMVYSRGLAVFASQSCTFEHQEQGTSAWLALDAEPGLIVDPDGTEWGYIRPEVPCVKVRVVAAANSASVVIHRPYNTSTSRGQVNNADA